MKEILKQLLEKLVSYFLFMLVIFFTSLCLLTGELPPRIQSVKTQYQSFIEMKKNYSAIMQKATERLNAAETTSTTAQPVLASLPSDFEQNLKELRVENVRIQNQLDYIKLQNQEILKRLSLQK